MGDFVSWCPGDVPDSRGRRRIDRPPPVGFGRTWLDGGIPLRSQGQQALDLLTSPLWIVPTLLLVVAMAVLSQVEGDE